MHAGVEQQTINEKAWIRSMLNIYLTDIERRGLGTTLRVNNPEFEALSENYVESFSKMLQVFISDRGRPQQC